MTTLDKPSLIQLAKDAKYFSVAGLIQNIKILADNNKKLDHKLSVEIRNLGKGIRGDEITRAYLPRHKVYEMKIKILLEELESRSSEATTNHCLSYISRSNSEISYNLLKLDISGGEYDE